MIETLAFILTGLGLTASIVYYASVLRNANTTRKTQLYMQLFLIISSEEFMTELSFCLLLPAVKEIDNKFKTSDNYYKYAFQLLHYILEKDFENCTLDQFVITKKTNTANLIKNNCVQ